MKINANLALIPVYQDIKPVESISKKTFVATDLQEERLVRLSYSGSKTRRVGNIYDRIGDVKNKNGLVGENVDLYV
jgi:hypothetical protein